MIRRLIATALLAPAACACLVSYVVDPHRYAWSDEPGMARMVDLDALLVGQTFSALAILILATCAAVWFWPTGPRRGPAALAFAALLLAMGGASIGRLIHLGTLPITPETTIEN